MLLQLAEDRRRLKGVQSTVKKAQIKVELLPKYTAWADGVLAAGGAQQDDVLMFLMLWRMMPVILPVACRLPRTRAQAWLGDAAGAGPPQRAGPLSRRSWQTR
jgi:hypothetical protein